MFAYSQVAGVLVECDPSIKAIILKIDSERHDYIVEDLDDSTLVIKEKQLPSLKARLDEVDGVVVGSKDRALLMLPYRSWRTRKTSRTSLDRIEELCI